MRIDEIRKNIEGNSQKFSLFVKELEAQKTKLSDLVKVFVKEENNRIIVECVSKNGEHARKVGLVSLKELKGRTEQLYQRSDSIMDGVLVQEKYWQHQKLKDLDSASIIEHGQNGFERAGKEIKLAIKHCLGFSGELLSEYGFVQISENTYYNDIRMNGWYRRGGEVFRGDEPSLPEQIIDEIRDYKRMLTTLYMIVSEKEKLGRELEQKETIDIWDRL